MPAVSSPALALSSTAAPSAVAPSASTVAAASASGLAVAAGSAGPEASAAPASLAAPPATREPPEGMALVPGGDFVMGADDEGELDERPAHRVTLPPFFLDLTEVTNEAYEKCVEAGACRPHDSESARVNKVGDDRAFRRPRQPISAVSWDDALGYCRRLGKRLPTEAEFEKASRGTDGRRYPWGNEFPDRTRSVFGEAPTADVGSRPAGRGPYGHFDLTGNVWEWIADFYDPYAYRRPGVERGESGTCEQTLAVFAELRQKKMQGFTGTNPIPTECEHVLRGGAFNYNARGLRSSNRVHHPGRFRLIMSGFRCAMTALSSEEQN